MLVRCECRNCWYWYTLVSDYSLTLQISRYTFTGDRWTVKQVWRAGFMEKVGNNVQWSNLHSSIIVGREVDGKVFIQKVAFGYPFLGFSCGMSYFPMSQMSFVQNFRYVLVKKANKHWCQLNKHCLIYTSEGIHSLQCTPWCELVSYIHISGPYILVFSWSQWTSSDYMCHAETT